MKDAYSNNGDIQACNSSSQYDMKRSDNMKRKAYKDPLYCRETDTS